MIDFVLWNGKTYKLPDDAVLNCLSPEDLIVDLEMYYDNFTDKLHKPAEDLMAEMTLTKCELNHYAIGVSGEVGELLDAIKKHTMYNKEIDRENIIEELGDIEWYLSNIRRLLEISREETLLHNMQKLSKRYSKLSFSNQDAETRMDKKEVNKSPESEFKFYSNGDPQ